MGCYELLLLAIPLLFLATEYCLAGQAFNSVVTGAALAACEASRPPVDTKYEVDFMVNFIKFCINHGLPLLTSI